MRERIIKDIMEKLNITCSEETVSRYIKLLMLSIYRLQNGIKVNYSYTDEEIEKVVAFVQKEQEPQYLFEQEDLLAKAQVLDERDELFVEACEFVIEQNGASTSSLQRKFHIGYNRAARLIEMLESSGIISEARGSKPREVLMSYETLQEWLNDDAD